MSMHIHDPKAAGPKRSALDLIRYKDSIDGDKEVQIPEYVAIKEDLLKRWVTLDPETVKNEFAIAAAPKLAQNILEAMGDGKPCRACGRKRYGERWANRLAAQVTKWLPQPLQIVNIVGGILTDLGVGSLEEAKRFVAVGKQAERDATDEHEAYQILLKECNDYRRSQGLDDLIEPERLEPAVVEATVANAG